MPIETIYASSTTNASYNSSFSTGTHTATSLSSAYDGNTSTYATLTATQDPQSNGNSNNTSSWIKFNFPSSKLYAWESWTANIVLSASGTGGTNTYGWAYIYGDYYNSSYGDYLFSFDTTALSLSGSSNSITKQTFTKSFADSGSLGATNYVAVRVTSSDGSSNNGSQTNPTATANVFEAYIEGTYYVPSATDYNGGNPCYTGYGYPGYTGTDYQMNGSGLTVITAPSANYAGLNAAMVYGQNNSSVKIRLPRTTIKSGTLTTLGPNGNASVNINVIPPQFGRRSAASC